jgi:hypothetical protein
MREGRMIDKELFEYQRDIVLFLKDIDFSTTDALCIVSFMERGYSMAEAFLEFSRVDEKE